MMRASRVPRTRTALVVKNDPPIRSLLSVLLECEGFEVRTATHGSAVIDEISSGRVAACAVIVVQVSPAASPVDHHEDAGIPVLHQLSSFDAGLLRRTVVLTTTREPGPPFDGI